MEPVTTVNCNCINCYSGNHRYSLGYGSGSSVRFEINLFIFRIMENQVQQQDVQQQETKWYVLRVVSGKERKVKEYLDKETSRGGWVEVVKQVFLPVEK